MQKNELFEDLNDEGGFWQKHLGLSLVKFIILVTLISGVGLYMGLLLYGTNSIEVLTSLQDYQEYLQVEIDRLKNDNAELQREFFELKELNTR